MQLRLLLDANLSWRSAAVLKQHFDDCLHVDYIGMQTPVKDTEIWDYAKANNLFIVTNDEDFFNLSSFRSFPPKDVLLRQGNHSRRYVEQLLISLKPRIEMFGESDEHGVLEII
ncbi:MAG: DUF5615 family PIN-like protein [Dysgonamonadaceae bacterium]|jgi:predicted nuclease of predicted toxin-antitoxin system|nr:DUF5615 family PIN-like protein [Dysgonamonadaceae bacterium]